MALEVMASRRRFTRAEYYRMAEVGILGEADRVELIEGEIIEMSPIGRRHRAFVGNLNQLLAVRLAGRAIVWMQNPIVLSEDTEPQPDLAVLRRRRVPYKEREAWAEDVLLLIEVADSSLAYDRTTKLRLYAEAGIPEYWLVDGASETVEVHCAPSAGGYASLPRPREQTDEAAGSARMLSPVLPPTSVFRVPSGRRGARDRGAPRCACRARAPPGHRR
jgi:Uma2 family endonuclease